MSDDRPFRPLPYPWDETYNPPGCPRRLRYRPPLRERLVAHSIIIALTLSACLLGLLGSAPPAAALGTCPTGFSSVRIAGGLECVDLAGNTGGFIDGNGNFTKAPTNTNPGKLTQPSSTLAAGNGGGGNTGQNAAGAGANGDPSRGGKLSFTKRALSNGAAIVTAGLTGYAIGQQLTGIACDWGATALCYPSKDSTIQPNTDVLPSQQPGWTNQTFSTGTTTAGQYTVKVGWTSAEPAAGAMIVGNNFGSIFTVTAVATTRTGSGTYWSASGFHVLILCQTGTTANGGTYEKSPYVYPPYNYRTNGEIVYSYGGGNLTQGGSYAGTIGGNSHTTGTYCSGTAGGIAGVSIMDNSSAQEISPITEWWAVGNTHRPADAPPGNPQRTLVATNTCTNTGGTTTTTTASSAAFTETDASYPAYPNAPQCPSGYKLTGAKVVETTPGLPDKLVWQFTVPDAVKTWQQTYPQCGDGTCRLGLVKIGPAGSKLGDCFATKGLCTGWYSDANKSTNYQCTYGPPASPTNVALTECNVYSPTFEPAAVAAGTPYGDPATGNVPDPSSSTGDGSSDPNPAPAGGAGGVSCFPSGWSAFNPAEWVLQPIKCALAWAFAPDQSSLTDVETQLRSDLDRSGWGAWVAALGPVFSALGGNGTGGDGCSGPEFDFDWAAVHVHGHPLSACAEPLFTAAAISRALVTVFVIVFGGMACLRAIGAAFGFEVSFGRGRAPGEVAA